MKKYIYIVKQSFYNEDSIELSYHKTLKGAKKEAARIKRSDYSDYERVLGKLTVWSEGLYSEMLYKDLVGNFIYITTEELKA